MINIEKLISEYAFFGKPIPYNELEIHPVMVKDSGTFLSNMAILNIDKNTFNDIEIIKMSYLKFLGVLSLHDKTILDKLTQIFRLVLKIDDEKVVYLLPDGKKNDYTLLITKPVNRGEREIADYSTATIITSKEFDDIKKIIMHQNIHDFDDDYIDPDVKKAVEEYHRIITRDVIETTVEKKVAAIQVETGMTCEEIYKMTYRQFNILFETMLDNIDYKILKTAELSGNVEFKKSIEHWVFKKEKGKFGDAFINADSFNNKMGSSSFMDSPIKMSEEQYNKEKERKHG